MEYQYLYAGYQSVLARLRLQYLAVYTLLYAFILDLGCSGVS